MLEKQLQESMTNVAEIPFSIGTDFTVELKPATQEFVDILESLILSADTLANYDSSVMSILVEEASTYFSGSKSAQDAADIAQNRIEMYINENR